MSCPEPTFLDLLVNPKVLTREQAIAERQRQRQAGLKMVLTNGCFDLLHAGHLYYLQAAANLGDRFWVLINGDASVRALKGPTRPIQDEVSRAYVMAGLDCVDHVMVFPNPRLDNEITLLEPDVYAKAGDYTLEQLDPGERAALEAVGAEIRFLPFLPGFSTTNLVQRITAAGGL